MKLSRIWEAKFNYSRAKRPSARRWPLRVGKKEEKKVRGRRGDARKYDRVYKAQQQQQQRPVKNFACTSPLGSCVRAANAAGKVARVPRRRSSFASVTPRATPRPHHPGRASSATEERMSVVSATNRAWPPPSHHPHTPLAGLAGTHGAREGRGGR
jgi:hypothetical protein